MDYSRQDESSGTTVLPTKSESGQVYRIEVDHETYLGSFSHFYEVKADSYEEALSCLNPNLLEDVNHQQSGLKFR